MKVIESLKEPSTTVNNRQMMKPKKFVVVKSWLAVGLETDLLYACVSENSASTMTDIPNIRYPSH